MSSLNTFLFLRTLNRFVSRDYLLFNASLGVRETVFFLDSIAFQQICIFSGQRLESRKQEKILVLIIFLFCSCQLFDTL